MKIIILHLIALLHSMSVYSQNLYTQSNAANMQNEANSVTGWTGPANITSSTDNPYHGTWAIKIETTSAGRDASYTFSAQIGTTYNISIWARKGSNNSNSAFNNWVGFTGFSNTGISSTTWTEYTFTVTATTANPIIRVYGATSGPNGRSAFIDAITITAQTNSGDTQPPTAPTNLVASNTTANSTNLTWNASTDNVAVTGYRVRQNNVVIATVSGTTLTYNVTGLTASTAYSFNVVAFDAANNVSPVSNTVQVTTLAGADTQPPTAPTNLVASNTTANSTNLAWNASTDNVAVTGYRVRQNNVVIATVSGTTLNYNVTGLTASTAYSFNVVAFDAANNVSPVSNTVQVTTTSGGGGGTPYTDLNANLPTINWQSNNLYVAGRMGIGTQPSSNFMLSVNGNIRGKDLRVESGWSDFVFEPQYILPSLDEVEQYIIENGHLSDIPSAKEVQENGVGLSNINTRLLQKIEELTLYLIEAEKKLQELEKSISTASDQ